MKHILASGTLILLGAVTLYAQGTTSRAVGTVQDPSGAVVAGAIVSLTNQGTGATFTTSTSAAGTYVFEAVQSGRYTVTVEAPGFKKFVSRDNVVTIGQPMTVNVTLDVGAVAESVEVTASALEIQTSTSGNFGNLLSERILKDLPLVGARGRNVLNLVLLQPGVVSGANTGGGVHVHGARDRAWNYTLDGIDINETSASGSNFSPLRTNPDSLAEFRVLTSNFTAEFGRNSGGQVAMITRSGSNEFHGTGFWFYRTPSLNANEWENNFAGLGKRQFVQHIYGGSVGGPVIRNHTFFFTNVQLLRALQTSVVSRTVYTEQARRGILRYVRGGRNRPAGLPDSSVDFNGSVRPGVSVGEYNVVLNDPQRFGFDPTTQGLINRTPLPNRFDGGDGLNTALFTFTDPEQERQRDFVFKVDHIFNPQNTFYARVAWGRQDTNCDTANAGQRFFPDTPCRVNTLRHPRNLAFNWRYNPTPRITNELVVGHSQFLFDFRIPTNDLNKTTLSGPITLPEAFYFGNKRRLRTLQIVDNFAYFIGPHSVKFGTNLRFQKHIDTRGSIAGLNAGEELNFSTGVNTVDPATFGIPADINITFDRPAFQSHINFLLGRVGSITRGFVAEGDRFVPGLYDFEARFPEHDFYIQDTWKLRKNLTVDLGLRWELKLTPSEPNNRISRPSQPMTAGAAPSTTIRWAPGSLYEDDRNNLGPSVGVAWDPTGRGKTSIRTNYRLAFDRIQTFVLSSAVFQSLPGLTQGVVNTAFGQGGGRLRTAPRLEPPSIKPSDLTQPPPFSNNFTTVVDPGLRAPITHQWAFGIQHEVASRSVVEINYIGRRAYGLLGAYRMQADIFNNGFLNAFKVVQAGGESDLMNRILASDSRRLSGETGSQMARRLFASTLNLNSVGGLAGSIASRLQGTPARSVTDLSGVGPFFFIPFPQFSSGVQVIDSNDFSTYHALEAQFERRFHNGLAWRASYTFAKSLDNRSFDPTFTVTSTDNAQSASSTPFDLANRKLNYARSDFDRTHVLQADGIWELPFARGKRDWASQIVGGWQIMASMRLTSGRPFTVYSGATTVSNIVQTPANCNGCQKSDGSLFDDATGIKFYLNDAERAHYSIPGPGEFGHTGRNFLSGPGAFNMDLGLLKRIYWKEKLNFEVRADMINVTNTPTFGFPTATFTSTVFGRERDNVISGSRKIQLGAKFNF